VQLVPSTDQDVVLKRNKLQSLCLLYLLCHENGRHCCSKKRYQDDAEKHQSDTQCTAGNECYSNDQNYDLEQTVLEQHPELVLYLSERHR